MSHKSSPPQPDTPAQDGDDKLVDSGSGNLLVCGDGFDYYWDPSHERYFCEYPYY